MRISDWSSYVCSSDLSAAVFAELLHIIAFEGLSPEWGGEPFDAESRVVGQPLALFDESCAWGKIDNLEAFCVEHGLPFVRWSGSYPRSEERRGGKECASTCSCRGLAYP